MPVQFTFWPALLLLPVLFAFFWWQSRTTVTDLSPQRRRLTLLLRCLLAALLVLALAGTRFVRTTDSLAVVFLVDSSRSVREEQREAIRRYLHAANQSRKPMDKVGLITFAGDPHTQSPLGQPLDLSRLRDPGLTNATDIAQALRLAKSELETAARDSGKRIVLLSDGNETVGRALAVVPQLAASQIRLDTVTLPAALSREALIAKTVLPNRVKIGEPFSVRVVVQSLTPQTATVRLLRAGKSAAPARQVELHPGKNVLVFEQRLDRPGVFQYGVALDAPEDTIAENNRGEGFVWVRGKPTVLYVADSPALTGFLRKTLQAQNIVVEYMPPEAVPASPAALQPFDSILLSNVHASLFAPRQLRALQVACRDFGIGFGMVGGEDSFGSGGYRGTPIEETLPVRLDARKTLRVPAVSVALVVDRSSSMTETGPGGNKLALAKEAASRAVQALKPRDKVAVIAFDTEATVQMPLTSVEQSERIVAAIQAIQPGGGTSVYSGVKQAFEALKADKTPIKHIILLTDGVSSDPDYHPLITALRQQKITVTGVAIGAGTRSVYGPTLALLARATGGRFFLVENAQQVPGIYLQEIERITSPPIVEEPFQARPVEGDRILTGLDWRSAPPLLGYNISTLKPTAELSLVTHRNDPLFAGWRYGLGRSVAFLSDDRARWAAHWLGWPGYAQFWAQAVRWTLRPFAPSDYSTQVTLEGQRGHITVDAIDAQGRFVNGLQLRARVDGPQANSVQRTEAGEEILHQTAPGRYESWFDAPEMETYLVNVLQKAVQNGPERSTIVGLSTAYSPEYRHTSANDYLMTQLAQTGNGRANPAPRQVFGSDRPGVVSARDMAAGLLFLAMFLLPLDIAARRLALEKSDLKRALAWASARRGRRAARPAGTPELGRLRHRKAEVVAAREARSLKTRAPASGGETADGADIPLQAAPVSERRPESAPEAAVSAEAASEEPGAGMSRLLAAKRRAQPKEKE